MEEIKTEPVRSESLEPSAATVVTSEADKPISTDVMDARSGDPSVQPAYNHGLIQDIFPHAPSLSEELSPFKFNRLGLMMSLVLLLIIGSVGLGSFFLGGGFHSAGENGTKHYSVKSLPVNGVQGYDQLVSPQDKNLTVNGSLNVDGSFQLIPSAQPSKPATGQLFFDNTTHLLDYYNGSSFIALQQRTQGLQGPQGPAGLNGANGAPGPAGPSGASGSSGIPSDVAYTDKNGQTFTGNNQLFRNSADSTDAFQVQTAAGANLINADTSGSSLSLGANYTGTPVGYTTVGNNIDNGATKPMVADRYIAAASTTVTGITVYFENSDSSPQNEFQVAIYSDGASCGSAPNPILAHCPGSLIASSSSQVITGGAWNTAPLSTSITAGTAYWLVVNTNSSGGNTDLTVYNSNAGQSYIWDNSQTYGTWPSTFRTAGDFTSITSQLSMYADTASGSATPEIVTDSLGDAAIGSNPTDGVALTVTAQNSSLSALRVSGTMQLQADVVSALKVTNGSGTATDLQVDSVDGKVGIGGPSTWNGATLQVAGDIGLANVDAATGDNYLCYTTSSAIGFCKTNQNGAAFFQGGNSFGSTAVIGTNDANSLELGTFNGTSLQQRINITNTALASSNATLTFNGSSIFQPTTDSTTAFQIIQNSSGTPLLSADTQNMVLTSKGLISSVQSSSTNNVFTSEQSGDTAARFEFNAGGQLFWGTGSSAAGSELQWLSGYGDSNGMLWTNTTLGVATTNASDPAFQSTFGNQSPQFTITAYGNMSWVGSGSTLDAVNDGYTNGDLQTNSGLFSIVSNAATPSLAAGLSSDTWLHMVVLGNGLVEWGDGTGHDVTLSRTGVGSLAVQSQTNSTTAFQIQNSSGTPLFTADTTNMVLSVTSLVVNATLTVDGHIITGGSTPTFAAGVNAGTGASVSIAGNDDAGTITINTGTGAAAGDLADITFNSGYTATPRVILTPVGQASASLQYNVYSQSGTGFSVGSNTAPAASSTYTYNYQVEQ